jgi:hypothetical protein
MINHNMAIFDLIDEIADTRTKPTRQHHQAFTNNEKPVVTRMNRCRCMT